MKILYMLFIIIYYKKFILGVTHILILTSFEGDNLKKVMHSHLKNNNLYN